MDQAPQETGLLRARGCWCVGRGGEMGGWGGCSADVDRERVCAHSAKYSCVSVIWMMKRICMSMDKGKNFKCNPLICFVTTEGGPIWAARPCCQNKDSCISGLHLKTSLCLFQTR